MKHNYNSSSSEDSSSSYDSEKEPLIRTLIQYVGGKKRLIKTIFENIPDKFNNYFEPFVGGGVVAYNMIDRYVPLDKSAHLNDWNKDVMNINRVVKANPQELKKYLVKWEKEYAKILSKENKKIYFFKKRDELNKLIGNYNAKRAALYIFINKTCFNGMMYFHENGKCTSGHGTPEKPTLYNEDAVNNVHHTLNEKGIKIYNGDWKNLLPKMKAGDFVYFDPPYCKDDIIQHEYKYKDKNQWTDENSLELFKEFKQLGGKGIKAMMSNSYSKLVRKHFPKNKWRQLKIPIQRFLGAGAENRGRTYEVMIMNY
tara:strand:+ start:1626 stop:2561 length:936 start_codon:yes stop_codon:yes gene_type:complete